MADTFDVTGITKTSYAPPGGPIGPAYEVAFTTKPSNIVGTVVIPSPQFTPDETQRLVAAQAQILESVMRL